MADLVTYEHKRNEANGEDNRDGESHNRNWNCGVEGPTDDPEVLALRARQVRNHLATLLLSTGVPMLTAGDELGRTQQGNNNAYCQDNEISWIDWKDVDEDLLAFVTRLIAAAPRRHRCCARRRSSRATRSPASGGTRDLAWFAPDGGQLTTADWFDTGLQTLGMYLDGRGIRHRDEHGRPVVDDSLPGAAARRRRSRSTCSCPARRGPTATSWCVSTEYPTGAPPARTVSPRAPVELPGRCVWVLRVLRAAWRLSGRLRRAARGPVPRSERGLSALCPAR